VWVHDGVFVRASEYELSSSSHERKPAIFDLRPAKIRRNLFER
jgi:hypothetical protein